MPLPDVPGAYPGGVYPTHGTFGYPTSPAYADPTVPLATGVIAGKPGSFTPAGATGPETWDQYNADPNIGIGAPGQPAEAFAEDEYVVAADGWWMNWNGFEWNQIPAFPTVVTKQPGMTATITAQPPAVAPIHWVGVYFDEYTEDTEFSFTYPDPGSFGMIVIDSTGNKSFATVTVP